MRHALGRRRAGTDCLRIMLWSLCGVTSCAWMANAFEDHLEYALPAEYLPADMPNGVWQQSMQTPPSIALQEVDWDEATPVDLDQLMHDRPFVVSPFGDYFYRPGGKDPPGWLIGNGDQLGIFSLTLFDGRQHKLGWLNYEFGAGIHFISGPEKTDLPPRVYDFTVGFPYQGTIGDAWSYDVMFRMGWFSDFEGSTREGIRFPSHAVIYRRTSEWWQWVLGLEYLDRGDIALLPVFGALWTPNQDWRVEAVFPKPLIGYRFGGSRWTYLASEMGGGTWDIERAWGAEDVFTYRDFRLLLGIKSRDPGKDRFMEFGYVFSRHLEYRSGSPDFKPPDTILLRSVYRY
jgi:hypothetical protein